MNKSFAILAVLVLSQSVLAQTKYVQRPDARPKLTDQVGAVKTGGVKSFQDKRLEYKSQLAGIKPVQLVPTKVELTKEQILERDSLIGKYKDLVSARAYEKADYVAGILLEKYQYKVEPYVVSKYSAEEQKMIDEYQAKYSAIYFKDPKNALGLYNTILDKFDYKLIAPAKSEPVRDLASVKETELQKAELQKVELQRYDSLQRLEKASIIDK